MRISRSRKSIAVSMVLGLFFSIFSSIGVFSSSANAGGTTTTSNTSTNPSTGITTKTVTVINNSTGKKTVTTTTTNISTFVSNASKAAASGVATTNGQGITFQAQTKTVANNQTIITNTTTSTNTTNSTSCIQLGNCYTPVTPTNVALSNCPVTSAPNKSFFSTVVSAVASTVSAVGNAIVNVGKSIAGVPTTSVNVTPTTTCGPPPFVAPPPTTSNPTFYGTVFFYTKANGGVGYYGSQPPVPSGLPAVSVDFGSCTQGPYLPKNGVDVLPIGRSWTYSYTSKVTLTGPTGPGNTKTENSSPLTPDKIWGACVYPQVASYQCYTDLVGATYQGVTGAPNSGVSTTRVTIPTGSTVFDGVAGKWSDVVNTDPKLVNGIYTGPVLSKWAYTPTKPGSYKTNFGKIYPASSPTTSILTNKKYCGGNLIDSVSVPLSLVDDGFYTLTSSGHYVTCYTVEKVNPNGLTPEFNNCSNPVLSPVVKADLERRCTKTLVYLGGVPSANKNDIFNDPNVCGTPPTCVTDGTCNQIIVTCASSGLTCDKDPVPSFSCSVNGYAKVLNNGTLYQSGNLIQVISNGQAWGITWPAAKFTSYGNIKDGKAGVYDLNTSLVIWGNSQPFNWNPVESMTDPNAQNQPVATSNPALSLSTDPSPITVPNWGDSSTIQFYKKGSAGDKLTFSQRQWFTAYFPHTQVVMDANGNYVTQAGWIEETKHCDDTSKQSFTVLGVNVIPGK